MNRMIQRKRKNKRQCSREDQDDSEDTMIWKWRAGEITTGWDGQAINKDTINNYQ